MGIVDSANDKCVNLMQEAQPVLVDVARAGEVIPGLDRNTLLHAGPPIEWSHMCGPMRGAVMSALKFENMAANNEDAAEMASSGDIVFAPCHEYGCVGPMTGIISYSMPVYVVQNLDRGNRAYAMINEGMGDVLRFGATSKWALDNLRFITEIVAPILKEALYFLQNPINLKVIMTQALIMGDELHMRNSASTNIFIKNIAEAVVAASPNIQTAREVLHFLTTNNEQCFLNLGMAAAKCSCDAAHGVKNSSIVTAMARNGHDFGIRVSGLGDRWFSAPAAAVDGLYFPGYSADDANPDIGDSAIMETVGVGAFAMAASPGVINFVGAGGFSQAVSYTREMYGITVQENRDYLIPSMDNQGTPTGIDVRRVVEKDITPAINTAIASREAGVGMIGAGIARAPIEPFINALLALAEELELD